jgi:hypothetical protein
MNTGQMMLTIGAMAILSMTTLRVNSHFVHSGVSLDQTKFAVLAVSLASSRLEEANSKAFDENTTESAITSSAGLSASIGKDAGETTADTFDDCDDFNNYVDSVSNIPSAKFYIKCKVAYINPAAPDVDVTASKTLHKRITVLVTSPSMTDTVKLSSIFSYWYYR